MNFLALFGVLFLCLLVLAPLLARVLCHALGLVRPNFQGKPIPAAIGITFLTVAVVTYAALMRNRSLIADVAPIYLIVAAGFGLLGLADDLWGSRAVGGFRGHIGALLRGRPTTGSVKLLGGGAVALAAAWMLPRQYPWELVLDALLIALSANALNLLDVRPGRALFGFALLALPTFTTIAARYGPNGLPLTGGVLLGAVALAAAIEWLPDTRGRVMMGDIGSNLLGAVAGLAAAMELPLWGRVLLLLLLLALNLTAERSSLSQIIERSPFLRAIDRRLGVR